MTEVAEMIIAGCRERLDTLTRRRVVAADQYKTTARRMAATPFTYEAHNPLVNTIGNLRTLLSDIDSKIQMERTLIESARRFDEEEVQS